MSSSLAMLLVMLLTHVGKRSNSRSEMFFKICFLKNSVIFTEKHPPVLEPFLNKVAGLKACIFIKGMTPSNTGVFL